MPDTPWDPAELVHLRRAVALAAAAVEAGDHAFGTVLVSADGTVLAEERNQVVTTADPTAHPEIAVARWAAAHLDPAERSAATTFTSGEHCPMCAAAHAWVGLGPVVAVHTGAQLARWQTADGVAPSPVAALSVPEVAPGVLVRGPVPELTDEVRALHARVAAR